MKVHKSKTARKIVKLEKRVVRELYRKGLLPDGQFLVWGEKKVWHQGREIMVNVVKTEIITYENEIIRGYLILNLRYSLQLILARYGAKHTFDYYANLRRYFKEIKQMPVMFGDNDINGFLKKIRLH